jgi:hypothetical protein
MLFNMPQYATSIPTNIPLYATSTLPAMSAMPVSPQRNPATSLGSNSPRIPGPSNMDDLPLPNPPSGWVLSSCRTKVKQFIHSVEYEYEYTYAKERGKSKQLPTSIEAPFVPPHWITTKSRHTAEKNADTHVYRYALAYRSPNLPSASPVQMGVVAKTGGR